MNSSKLIFILIILLHFGCVERFIVDVPDSGGIYLVESILLDDPRHQYTKLYISSPDGSLLPVSGAKVVIEDDIGNAYEQQESTPGSYIASNYLALNPSNRYRLMIDLNDGHQLMSAWEPVPEKVEIDSGYYSLDSISYYNINGVLITQRGIRFLVDTRAFVVDQSFLRWEYETTHINEAPFFAGICDADNGECVNCYVTSTPTNFLNVTRVLRAKGKSLLGHPVDLIPLNERFSFRFTMLLKQVTHTESANNFYSTIQKQQQISGSIFDPPPTVVEGNIVDKNNPKETVYGVFELGRYDEVAITVYNGSIEVNILKYYDTCDQKRLRNEFDPGCYNCNNAPGAGPRPYYF